MLPRKREELVDNSYRKATDNPVPVHRRDLWWDLGKRLQFERAQCFLQRDGTSAGDDVGDDFWVVFH